MKKIGSILIILLLIILSRVFANAQTPAKLNKVIGTVVVVVEDSHPVQSPDGDLTFPADGKASYGYGFITKSGFYKLEAGDEFFPYINEKVELTGTVSKSVLKVSSITASTQKSSADTPPRTAGNLTVHIVSVSENQTAPGFMSPADARAPIFYNTKSVKAFYSEMSGRDLTFSGNEQADGEYSQVVIPAQFNNCNTGIGVLAPLIDERLPANRKPSEYNAAVYVVKDDIYSRMGCQMAGTTVVGTPRVLTKGNVIFIPESIYLSSAQTIIHEFGHTLGLHHSRALHNGVLLEYGDQGCVMGGSLKYLNSYQRRRLGWTKQPPQEITASGTYDVYPLASNRKSGVKVLQNAFYVVKDQNGSLTGRIIDVEARKELILFDEFRVMLQVSYVEGTGLRDCPLDNLAPLSSCTMINTRGGQYTGNNGPLWYDPAIPGSGIAVIYGMRFEYIRVGSPQWGNRIRITLPVAP